MITSINEWKKNRIDESYNVMSGVIPPVAEWTVSPDDRANVKTFKIMDKVFGIRPGTEKWFEDRVGKTIKFKYDKAGIQHMITLPEEVVQYTNESIDVNTNFKVDLNILYATKHINKYTRYSADVIIRDVKVGSVRLDRETINLDQEKVGKTRTRTYFSLSWDQKTAADMFGYKINNYSRKVDDAFNSTTSSVLWTTKRIENYIKEELARLNALNTTQE